MNGNIYVFTHGLQENWDFKAVPRPGGLEANKNAFENDSCQKRTRLTQKKKFQSPLCLGWSKEWEKSLRYSWKPLSSAAMVQKHLERSTRFLNDLKNHGNRILICSSEKNFTVDPVFNKQNDRVVRFRNNVSKPCRVSTTKRPDTIMMFGVVASDEEKMPPGFAWTGLQANPCNLQRSFEDAALSVRSTNEEQF